MPCLKASFKGRGHLIKKIYTECWHLFFQSSYFHIVNTLSWLHCLCRFSNHSWRWRSLRTRSEPGETWAWTVMRTPQSLGAAAIHSQLTLKTLAGTGLLPQSATRQTIALGSVSTCTCRSTHIPTWLTRPTPEGPQAPAVPPPRCHPSTCSTLIVKSRSSMARSPPWWWTVVDALEFGRRHWREGWGGGSSSPQPPTSDLLTQPIHQFQCFPASMVQ